MRRSDYPREFNPTRRTTQIIYGERQHLKGVLDSIQKFVLKTDQLDKEKNLLQSLIEERTRELNGINRDWDRKLELARDPQTSSQELALLAESAPADDYLLLRTIAEHPNTPATILDKLSEHPYDAVQENVARHPNASVETLEQLAADPSRPLWFLVACNAAAPAALRDRLKRRMTAAAAAGTN
ncbi:MAG: hypothetical protein LAN37_06025 [Acidobacteriia bacterium]|nr:hypothetical protein [Terriglobia bacterium]